MSTTIVVPWFGVGLAVIVAFLANSLWFGPKTLYPVWWRAMGKSPDEQPGEGRSMVGVFSLILLALIVEAFALSWVLQAAAKLYDLSDISPGTGALIGLGIGIAFAALTSLGHRLFAGQGLLVWIIEAGGDVLGLTLMGLVLSIYV
jgi:Protein of unknown function (DUF1761)